jgi:hypothetical protein
MPRQSHASRAKTHCILAATYLTNCYPERDLADYPRIHSHGATWVDRMRRATCVIHILIAIGLSVAVIPTAGTQSLIAIRSSCSNKWRPRRRMLLRGNGRPGQRPRPHPQSSGRGNRARRSPFSQLFQKRSVVAKCPRRLLQCSSWHVLRKNSSLINRNENR